LVQKLLSVWRTRNNIPNQRYKAFDTQNLKLKNGKENIQINSHILNNPGHIKVQDYEEDRKSVV